MFNVYVKIDSASRVVDIASSAFLQDTEGWVAVDQGCGSRFVHAQHNYLPTPLKDDNGVFLYKVVDGVVTRRTAEEVASDSPATAKVLSERVTDLEEAFTTILESEV